MKWEMHSALEFFGHAISSTYLLSVLDRHLLRLKYYDRCSSARGDRCARDIAQRRSSDAALPAQTAFLFNTLQCISTLILATRNRTANQTGHAVVRVPALPRSTRIR